jgi:hypothetical protein
MNYTEIHRKAVQWMVDRGWREAYGKKGAFTQSILQHTDVELNVLLELLPILARPEHSGLSDLEQQALIVGQIVHDVGKESEKWQQYVKVPREQQHGNYVPHVIRPLTDEAVIDLVDFLGFPHSVVPDATKFVNLHMAATRNITNVLAATLLHKGNSIRWNWLARIVDEIDNICSIPALLPTLQAIENNQQNGGAIGPHIKLAYHLVSIRGVSTVLLHKAAEKAYRAEGWLPLLYFSEGTIYAADSLCNINEPSHKQILSNLAEAIGDITDKDYSQLIVGNNFSATVIPKPELFNSNHLRQYLKTASTRLKKNSFESSRTPKTQITQEEREKIEADNKSLIKKYLSAKGKQDGINCEAHDPTPNEIQFHIMRFAEHQPDLGVWIFFSAACKLGLLGNICNAFELTFGQNSYARFMQCPKQRQFVENMINGAEIFGCMKGDAFGYPVEQMELLPPERRIEKLIDTLVDIVNKSEAESVNPSALAISQEFSDDLIHPVDLVKGVATTASVQLENYTVTKKHAFSKAEKARLCPICNCAFEKGTVAKKDFIDSPEAHTNRATSHGSQGYIVICNACKYERFLQQLLLGEKVSRVLVITPRNHIGRATGAELLQQVESFRENASIMMSNDTNNPNRQVTLALTGVIAGNLFTTVGGHESITRLSREGFSGSELSAILSYTLGEEKQKEYRKALRKAILEEYELEDDANIAEMNQIWETQYVDWEAAVEGVISGKLSNETLDEIRVQTYRLRPQLKVICQTPNLILVPLRYGFAVGKESDTNAALREMFALLLIGLALDCSIAAIDSGETITFVGGEGVARVPAVPAIRDLIGSDWVSLEHAKVWLEKIGAASLLADVTAYPERSNLYEILRAMTPGHILRRIEMKSKPGRPSSQDYQWIRFATQTIQQS